MQVCYGPGCRARNLQYCHLYCEHQVHMTVNHPFLRVNRDHATLLVAYTFSLELFSARKYAHQLLPFLLIFSDLDQQGFFRWTGKS